jgi:hypothetical protein
MAPGIEPASGRRGDGRAGETRARPLAAPRALALAILALLATVLLSSAARAADLPPARTATAEADPPELAERPSPLGYAGPRAARSDIGRAHVPIEDRWRVGIPSWRRYEGSDAEAPYAEGWLLDPYGQNVLKGDYPVLGDDIFLDVLVRSDTIAEARSSPIPSGVSTARRRSERFFGEFDQLFGNENLVLSVELFKGDTAFRPKDWAIRATPVLSVNYTDLREVGVVNVDVREGRDRVDGHVGFQELFVEVHLADLGPSYDFLTSIVGVQPFTSDFRGFLYSDQNLGARLQANFGANRIQANLAWFHQLDKETNSGLNEWEQRNQNVLVANLFVQDFLVEGYTALASWHFNRDHGSIAFDDNGFLVRPARIGAVSGALGDPRSKDVDVHYLGWGGDGHVGPLNITHQYYLAFGTERRSPISGRTQRVRAHFAALEPSVDVDWLRVKLNLLYASGDKDPLDGRGTGFDAIVDNPFFAGSGFSYWNRQQVPLVQTGVNLVNRLSLLPSLRTSKVQGQASFVNPGLYLAGAGLSGKLTPKLSFDLNANAMWLAETETLGVLEQQRGIERALGIDYSVGVQWRPLLIENVIVTAGAGALTPLEGFSEIYRSTTLYSGFIAVTLTY